MQFRVIVVTDPQTNKPTNRQDGLQYTAPLSLARSVINRYVHICQTIEILHFCTVGTEHGAVTECE